jgi:hypothetical protein
MAHNIGPWLVTSAIIRSSLTLKIYGNKMVYNIGPYICNIKRSSLIFKIEYNTKHLKRYGPFYPRKTSLGSKPCLKYYLRSKIAVSHKRTSLPR